MRFPVVCLAALLLAGCAGKQNSASARRLAAPPAGSAQTNLNVIVTPASLTGKVASVNGAARFAVLAFPLGNAPANDRRFNIYRGGLKVGEIKITGPRRDNHTVGDIVAGECQVGDEVREN